MGMLESGPWVIPVKAPVYSKEGISSGAKARKDTKKVQMLSKEKLLRKS